MAKRTAEIIDLVDSSSDSEDREQGIGWLPLAQQHKQQLLQGPGQPSSAASGEVAPAAAAATALHTPALRPPPAAPPPITNSLLAQLARERSGRQRQQQAGGETGPAAAARTVEAAAAGGPAAAADMASANLQPVRLLDLFSGLSTAACGALRAGLRVEAYAAVEVLPGVRRMAEHHLRLLQGRHGRAALPDSAIASAHTALPQDVCRVTADHIRALGRIDVVTAGFPCQDLSRSKRGDQLGLRGPKSRLFFQAAQILEWVKEANPGVAWCFENVDFSGHSEPAIAQGDWRTVQRLLGVSPVVFDAALVSPAHRIRAYWTNIDLSPPPRRVDRDLATVLDPCHRPKAAHRSDSPSFPPGSAAFNVKGRPARKYPTVCRTWRAEDGAYNTQNGTAYVVRRDSGREVLPNVAEIERIVGLDAGATAAAGASEDERRQACGNIWDAHVLTYLFQQARPYLPQPGGGRPECSVRWVQLGAAAQLELAREAGRTVEAAGSGWWGSR